jgi:DNA repair protein RadA/Sms
MEELSLPRTGRGSGAATARAGVRLVPLTEVAEDASRRLPLGWNELNRVLGGGLVPGSVVLVGGEPGVGKSTLLTHVAAQVAATGGEVLYVSAEESPEQVRLRASRLDALSERVLMLPETDIDAILNQLSARRPALAIVDSIQTVSTGGLDAGPGSVSQVRECTALLTRAAKESGVPVILVGHVTKEGAIAGPRVLEHMVDTVLYLEGERRQDLRILRATKNRFGSTEEIGIFAMHDSGLHELDDPGSALIESSRSVPGTAVLVAMEGTRPLLVELQSLVSSNQGTGPPRYSANGIDFNRMLMVLAVLEKRARVHLGASDVFVNVAGGLRLSEPAADLALALTLAGNQRNLTLPQDTVIIGELGLTGEVRRVSQLERRLQEAARRGFRRALTPRLARRNGEAQRMGLEVVEVEDLAQAIALAFKPEVAVVRSR